jgi:hypothetical protein
MQHIQLDNNSFILNINGTLTTITRKSFNFNKISKLLKEEAPEENIVPLLKTPDLSNGVYEIYIFPSTDAIFYKHFTKGSTTPTTLTVLGNTKQHSSIPKDWENYFVGVYASEADIKADWPEYFL